MIITTQTDLDTFCSSIYEQQINTIGIDTEFIREETYRPHLCLIQVSTPNSAVAIDPLAGLDLSALYKIFLDQKILKIFHAAFQDLEIFYYQTGSVPKPIFDTQVAAMACGYGDAVSYEGLVGSIAKATIDKGSRFTDWSRRPLTERQLEYALSDVQYLHQIYSALSDKMKKSDRTNWINEEISLLESESTYEINPDDAWKKIRYRSLKPKDLAVLKIVASMREHEAKDRNLPRGWVVKDETLLEIAASKPRDMKSLLRIRGINSSKAGAKFLPLLIDGVNKALAMNPSEYPDGKINPNKSKINPAKAEMLRVLLKIRSEELGIAPKLIANSGELDDFVRGEENVRFMSGWRLEIFGKYATELLQEKLAIAIKDSKISLIKL